MKIELQRETNQLGETFYYVYVDGIYQANSLSMSKAEDSEEIQEMVYQNALKKLDEIAAKQNKIVEIIKTIEL